MMEGRLGGRGGRGGDALAWSDRCESHDHPFPPFDRVRVNFPPRNPLTWLDILGYNGELTVARPSRNDDCALRCVLAALAVVDGGGLVGAWEATTVDTTALKLGRENL